MDYYTIDPTSIKEEWKIANKENDLTKKKILIEQMRQYLRKKYSPEYALTIDCFNGTRPYFKKDVTCTELRNLIETLVYKLPFVVIPDSLKCNLGCSDNLSMKACMNYTDENMNINDCSIQLPDGSYILKRRHRVFSSKNNSECLVYMQGESESSEDEYVFVTSLKTMESKSIKLDGYITEVQSMFYDRFVCAGCYGNLEIYDLLTEKCTHRCQFGDYRFYIEVLSPNQVCAMVGNNVYVCNIDTQNIFKIGNIIKNVGKMKLCNDDSADDDDDYIDDDSADDDDDSVFHIEVIRDERGNVFVIQSTIGDVYEITVRDIKTLQIIYDFSVYTKHFVSIRDGYLITNQDCQINVFDIENGEFVKSVKLDAEIIPLDVHNKIECIRVIQPDTDIFEMNTNKKLLWIMFKNGLYLESLYNSSQRSIIVYNSLHTTANLPLNPLKMYLDGSIVGSEDYYKSYGYLTNSVLDAIYIYADKILAENKNFQDDLGLFNVLDKYKLDFEFSDFGKEVLCLSS